MGRAPRWRARKSARRGAACGEAHEVERGDARSPNPSRRAGADLGGRIVAMQYDLETQASRRSRIVAAVS